MMNGFEYTGMDAILVCSFRAAIYCRLSKDDDLDGELDATDVFVSLIAQKHSQKISEESGKNNLAKTQDLCYTKDKVQVTGVPSGLCG